MKIKSLNLKKQHYIGIASALCIILVSFILMKLTSFFSKELFYFLVGVSFIIGGFPFFVSLIFETKREENKEQMFLEFARDLVESVRSGTSISKSILNIKKKDYGALTPHIHKLANQIALGITLREAFDIFARDLNSRVISRAVSLIKEAERAGGKIEVILESVAASVNQTEKLRKERKAAIYSLTIQGYIIFFIFIAIVLVMQYWILPITSEFAAFEDLSTDNNGIGGSFGFFNPAGGAGIDTESMMNSFIALLITQGFFVGLVIGKIAEGKARSGLKHSFILIAIAIVVATGSRLFL